jgi:hypothetical protein
LVAHPEQSKAPQLTKRALFNLANAFSADAENGGDFLERVFPFACYDERAVAGRMQTVLTVATMLEVVAALRLAAEGSTVVVRAITYRRKATRLPIRQFAAGLPRNMHPSI